ncbi:MAG: hypothetical protein R3A80_03440 [Bdellovibrionota bacterium]
MRCLVFLFYVCTPVAFAVNAKSEISPYLLFRKELSTHCLKDIYRGIYKEASILGDLSVDYGCPRKIHVLSTAIAPVLFVSNSNESWVVYSPDGHLVSSKSVVEYYPNPDARWPSLWMTLFQKIDLVVTPEMKNEAAEIMESYDLRVENSKQMKVFFMTSKKSELPSLILSYKEAEPLPVRIQYKARSQLSLDFSRVSLEKLKNLSPRHFVPDITKAKSVNTLSE